MRHAFTKIPWESLKITFKAPRRGHATQIMYLYLASVQLRDPNVLVNYFQQKVTALVSPTPVCPEKQNSFLLTTRSNSPVTSRSCRVTSYSCHVTSCLVMWVSRASGGRRRSWRRWRRFVSSWKMCPLLLCCPVGFCRMREWSVNDCFSDTIIIK